MRFTTSELRAIAYHQELDLRRSTLRSIDPSLLPREDLTVQLCHDDGRWHRRAVGGHHTACGLPILHGTFHSLRHEVYAGAMCERGCFSRYELGLADTANTDRAAHELAEDEARDQNGTQTWPSLAISNPKPDR